VAQTLLSSFLVTPQKGEVIMAKRLGLLLLLGMFVTVQYACSPLTAGVVGAGAGAAAQHHHDQKHDND
jgi:hypothetical protein